MIGNELAHFYGSALEIAPRTIIHRHDHLREADLFVVGKQGPGRGGQVNNTDAINSLLANILNLRRGECTATAVRRVRALRPDEPLIELPAGLTSGLTCFKHETAGAALDALIADMRTGRLAEWAAGETYTLAVTLDSRGASAFISLRKPQRWELDFRSAVRGFAEPGFRNRSCLVERNVTVNGDVFLQLAEKLGPH